MYQTFVTKNGAVAARETLQKVQITHGADGVEEITPQPGFVPDILHIPPRLLQWLIDVRLLRHLPIAYMVPDAALLPPESIRFFNVDMTWIDRVIDGALAAGNVGTVDATFGYALLLRIREELDMNLKALAGNGWHPATEPMSGMLMRSEAVRRWPNMVVSAFSDLEGKNPMPVLRAEAISQSLYIALFAGRPERVELREPFSGLRFGVESKGTSGGPPYEVNKRQPNGAGSNQKLLIELIGNSRVVNFNEIRKDMQPGWPGTFASRGVALQLEQLPYRQVFLGKNVAEKEGAQPATILRPMRRGGTMIMTKLAQRAVATKLQED